MVEQCEAHDGGITDEALIGLLGNAFDEGGCGRAASDVLARGRRLRRRKRALPALGVVAVSAGPALALTGPGTSAGPADASSGHALTSRGTVMNVDEASFSVHTDAKTGDIAITFHQLFHDEDGLKKTLAEAGVPVVVNSLCGKLDITDRKVLSAVFVSRVTHTGDLAVTVDPSKMPSGSVLEFDVPPGPYLPYTAVGFGLLSAEPSGACASARS